MVFMYYWYVCNILLIVYVVFYWAFRNKINKLLPPFMPPLNVAFIVSKKPNVLKTWVLFSGKIHTFDTHV